MERKKRFEALTADNYLEFALEYYDNRNPSSNCIPEEFLKDMERFNYIDRSLRRYSVGKNINMRLVQNHIITLYNMFGDAATPLLFFKISPAFHPIIAAHLKFLYRLPLTMEVEINQTVLHYLENHGQP